MKSNRFRLAISVFSTTIAALSIPFSAIVLLKPAEYGAFSLFYLVGAFANSLQLSVVSETWVRTQRGTSNAAPWAEYANATLFMAIIGGGAASAVALASSELDGLAFVVFLGVLSQVYRNGTRFRSLRNRQWRWVLPADITGAAVTMIALAVLFFGITDVGLKEVVYAWSGTKLITLLGSRPPVRLSLRGFIDWCRSRRMQIRTLVADSAMSDLAGIGTPFALLPIIGVSNLGIYRAVSNVAAPMRAVLAPLRPTLTSLPTRSLSSAKFGLGVVGAALVGAAATTGGLYLVAQTGWDTRTLGFLTPFAPAVGVYVFGMVVSAIFIIVVRQVARTKVVLTTRVVGSTLEVLLPIGGALVWGLEGAIWAYAIQAILVGGLWWIASTRVIKPQQ